MVYARKPLIYAGLLNTMVTQSYLNNLIETCPQITRNQFGSNPTRVRIPPSPYIKVMYEDLNLHMTFYFICVKLEGDYLYEEER